MDVRAIHLQEKNNCYTSEWIFNWVQRRDWLLVLVGGCGWVMKAGGVLEISVVEFTGRPAHLWPPSIRLSTFTNAAML